MYKLNLKKNVKDGVTSTSVQWSLYSGDISGTRKVSPQQKLGRVLLIIKKQGKYAIFFSASKSAEDTISSS